VDPVIDADLVVLDAAHLFDSHTTWIGFRRGALVRGCMYDFMSLLGPHLQRKLVRSAEKSETQGDVDRLLHHIKLPLHQTS
jgi:LysR family cys regulon transcriptional activator